MSDPVYDEANLHQEKQADYRVLNIRGEHHTIGQYLGQHTPLRTLPRRSPKAPDLDYAWACLRAVSRFHAGIEAEYRGFAETKGLPLSDLLPHISLNVTNGQVGQCSTFGYRGKAGQIVIGRNYDFRYRQQLRYLIHTAPPGYAALVGTNSGLIGGRYDGVNEHGLFVSLHTVMADRPEIVGPGVPFHLVVRIALETCRTAREAMDAIRLMPHVHSFNYFMADQHEMYVVEAHPEQVQVMGGRADILAATNHYEHPALQRLHGRRSLVHSRARLAYLSHPPQGWADDTYRTAQRLLSDHSVPVCGHQDGAATLWSAVCDPAERRVAYALGAPCRNPYQDMSWPGGNWAFRTIEIQRET